MQEVPNPTVLTRALVLWLAGVPPVGFGGRMRVIIDKRLQAVIAEPAQPAASAAAAATGAHPDHDPAKATSLDSTSAASSSSKGSAPRSTGRGSVGVVAAMAAMSVQDSPEIDTSWPAAATPTDAQPLGASHSCSNHTPGGQGANSTNSADSSSASDTGGPALLAVQCGAGAVLRLSFAQLLQLSGGADVADVADAPAEAAAAVSTLTGSSTGPSPQTPVSTSQRTITPAYLLAMK